MENMCGIKMFSAQDICKGLHVTKETAYAIMKMKESGARYVGRKLLISEDNLKKYLNNEKAPYLVKKARVKNDRPMCPKCSKCLNKDFCNHRRNLKLMNKCLDCHNCSDKEHCDKFYISEQYSVTIVVGVDEETGETIRKKFTGATQNEAIYKSEQFKKDNPGGLKSKPNKEKISPMTIEGITLEFMKQKNNNGTNNDNTYRTYSEILKRVKRNSGSWFDKKIDKISRKDVEDFLNYEREKGYAQNTLRKDYQLLKQAFGIAKERKFIEEDYFAGYYGIKMPQSIIKTEKVKSHTILGDRTKTPSGERDIVLTDSTLNDCLKRICKFIGIEDNAHNHKLRHSYSTNSYSVGIDYKVMEETLGHSDIRQTMDTYTDLPIETQRKELQKYVDSVKMLLGDSINEYTKEEKSLNP